MKILVTLALVGFSAFVLAQNPLPGACPAVVEVRALPFFTPKPEKVLTGESLEKIKAVRSSPSSIPTVTLLDELGKILLADPLFHSAYLGASQDQSRLALERLAGQLLQPQSEGYLVLLIALTELELIRHYTVGHLGAMGRMAEIIDSDPYYGEREAAIRKNRGLTLVNQLIVERDTLTVAQVMKRYYVEQHSSEPGPYPK